MKYIIGIDTGGTYTDTVLLNKNKKGSESVQKKSKALTTHNNLEIGINNSLAGLDLSYNELHQIEKVVLSTTLATNSIVEGRFRNTGVILIGDEPNGNIATKHIKMINGDINIKGRIIRDVDFDEIKEAIDEFPANIDSIAISGLASIKNPILEQKTKEFVQSYINLPIVCGSEIVSELGFLERTNTAIINAGLLKIINEFSCAIKNVLKQSKIEVPIFILKGDGNIAKLESIKDIPISTILSGPVASMIGAIELSESNNAVVIDIGGTTTDIGIVKNKNIELNSEGAMIGGWKIRTKSANLFTYGLGGDSCIRVKNNKVNIGPDKTLPACRGGKSNLTPTDILHATDEFNKWNKYNAINQLKKIAESENINIKKMVSSIEQEIIDKIYSYIPDENISDLPICVIGAPARSWCKILKRKYDLNIIIPEHYEVANAVGAASSGVKESVKATVRSGEDGYGYLAHTKSGRFSYKKRNTAIQKSIQISKEYLIDLLTKQNLEVVDIGMNIIDIFEINGELNYIELDIDNEQDDIGSIISYHTDKSSNYIETRIEINATGSMFSDLENNKNS